MNQAALLSLFQNAALLLALVVLFDIATSRQRLPRKRLRQALVGIAVGLLGVGLILSAYRLRPGIIFDTRSVLLAVCGLFLGPVPTMVAVLITGAFRLWQGGIAAGPGLAVIVSSGLLGVVWRHYRGKRLGEMSVGEFYLFGVIVHLVMLALMLLLPREDSRAVLATVGVPVLLIYPAVTTALSLLLVNRLAQEKAAQTLAESETGLRAALAEAEIMRTRLSATVQELERTSGVLRASEQQYRALFQANPHPMWISDRESRRFLAVNGAAVAQYGFSSEEFAGMTVRDLRPEEESTPQSKDLLDGGDEIEDAGVRRHRTKGGRVVRIQVASHELVWEDRGARLVLALDVTAQEETRHRLESTRQALLSVIEDHKQAEAALRTSEERYRSLVETSFDWIWEIDTRFRYTYASPRVRELLGYAPDEVVGRMPFDFMPAAEAQRVRAAFEQIVATREPFASIENVNRHRDGHLVVLETSGVPVFAADGTWLGYRGMDRDITARRTAEKTLRLRGAALEAAANAIVITDRSGVIEWANPAFVELSGWSLAEAIGRNPRDLIKSGEHDPAFYRGMWETIMAGRVWRGEVVNRRRDGTCWTEDMTIAPVRNEAGEISHFIAVKQDITRQKALEAQVIQSQRMEAIGTLASGIAHDLNNILAPILLVTDVVRGRLVEEADRELLSMTQASARRGADIVRQLLTFSRGQAGERSAVQPRHLLKEMVAIMRETFPRSIALRLESPVDLWTVEADPTQLHQVVLNLCVNARDAMPEGGILVVSASNAILDSNDPSLPPGLKAGAYVVLSVRDSGTGIPPEIRQRIFDPFFTTKPRGQGTGLGLATVLGIVRGHGGAVTVDSTLGKGTTFRVLLPAMTGEGAARAEDSRVEEQAAPARDLILVVDDEIAVRLATRAALEQHGHRVILAENGEDALKQYLVQRGEIHLILTDLMMPVMGGVALIRALRAIDPRTRVIAISGLIEDRTRRELEELGVREIVAKPTEVAELLAAVDRALRPT
ncbi:MAG: PAS domain S-box protein [Verrucomicrobia bacterium]|nr:PAS domain S-box protein [Verrucomicrobiota bacterium]